MINYICRVCLALCQYSKTKENFCFFARNFYHKVLYHRCRVIKFAVFPCQLASGTLPIMSFSPYSSIAVGLNKPPSSSSGIITKLAPWAELQEIAHTDSLHRKSMQANINAPLPAKFGPVASLTLFPRPSPLSQSNRKSHPAILQPGPRR